VFCVLGGEDLLRGEVDSIEYYNEEQDTWVFGPALQEPRFHPCAGLIPYPVKPTESPKAGTRLCVVGGANGSIAVNTAEVLPHDETSWSWVADMNDARQGAGCATVGKHLYVCGGSDRISGAYALATVEYYDQDINRWRRIQNMSSRRVGCCAAAIGEQLYVIGGAGSDRIPLSSVEVYDVATDSWTVVPDMGIPRQDAACAVVDGLLYVIGGFDGRESLDVVEVYDPVQGEWARLEDLCERRQGCGAAAVNGVLYVAGGMDCVVGSANADVSMRTLASAEAYNPQERKWQPIAPMLVARREPAAVSAPKPSSIWWP